MSVSRPSPHLSLPTPWVGVNYWSRRGGPLMWRQYDDTVVREELATLAAHGLTVTRSFLYWPDFQPAPDRIDEQYVERYHRFLAACEDVGIATIPTFIVGHMSGQNWDVAWRQGRDLYADGFMLGQQAFFIREMVRRFGGSAAVQAWLISNEMPLYGGPTTRENARAWGLLCTQAVRAGGSQLPVSLGDGAWTREITGADNGFRLADQQDVSDFIGPHSYPMGDDQLRQFTRAAFICELCHVGKPVVLEEFGVTSAFVADDHAADYYRQVLHHSLLAGATGWIGWNNTDFDLADTDPYRHHLYELTFGLTTAAGVPKPALAEMAAFADVVATVDLARCRRADTGTAVLVPSYLDTDHPMIDDVERAIIPEITLHAYLAAKRADLAPALVRESTGIPAAELLLVPSVKALTGPTFPELLKRAEAGATVYVGWFAGAGDGQRGAWWPDLEPLFGVRHRLRYGLNDLCGDDVVEVCAATGLGDLKPGSTLRFRPAGPPAQRAFLPVESCGAEVVLADTEDRPMLVRRRVGAGALYLSTLPVEYFGAVRPDANLDDDVWRLYRALAAEAGMRPPVSVDTPEVTVDCLVHEDGTRYVWLVSLSPSALSVVPDTSGRLTDVRTGEDLTARCELPPYGVRVARLEL